MTDTTTAYTGNAIPAPGVWGGRSVVDDEIMYSMQGYTQKGVTLKPGQGVLLGGTILTRDAETKQYIKGTAANAEGILRKTVDTGSSADARTYLGNIVIMGIVKVAAVKAANSGVSLTSVLNANVNENLGYFKF